VRAGLVERAEEWPWSSAAALLQGRPDPLVDPVTRLRLLAAGLDRLESSAQDKSDLVRRHTRHGRPWGDGPFLESIERRLGCPVRARPPGRPRRYRAD
jgi:putative transposase